MTGSLRLKRGRNSGLGLSPSTRSLWSGGDEAHPTSQRVGGKGNVVDGCVSTGIQAMLNEYLNRPTVFGLYGRTGGLAFWFALDMHRHQG